MYPVFCHNVRCGIIGNALKEMRGRIGRMETG